MRDAHPTERAIGIGHYVSDPDGIGGRLRVEPEDFRVRELETIEPAPLDADPGAYPHLLVRATLRDWDTNDFAREVADRLRMSRERVRWAGTKDKRAVTTQLFSLAHIDPDELPPIRDATVEPVGRFGRPLEYGDLAGNAFEVTVRGADHDRTTAITEALSRFGDGSVAVPNFFGQQRFGSRRPITHAVGLRLLRGDWEGAVMAYVGEPHEAEPADAREARRYVEETRDWSGALDSMPARLRYERAILHSLVETGGHDDEAYRTALEALPTNLQTLFVHAAQSYLFNRILSERLAWGLPFTEAVSGDVVCFGEEYGDLLVPDVDRREQATGNRLEPLNRHLDRRRAFVTAPLVGTETELAGGEPGAIERTVLQEAGLTPTAFDLPGEFGSTGTRRAILVRTNPVIEADPVTLSFTLPRGSYATVLLREYLKADPAAMR